MQVHNLFSVDELFFQISLKCCVDGKIAADEFALLRKIAALLKLDVKQANQLASQAIALYKSGQLETVQAGKPLAFTAKISGYHNLRLIFPEHLNSLHVKIERKQT